MNIKRLLLIFMTVNFLPSIVLAQNEVDTKSTIESEQSVQQDNQVVTAEGESSETGNSEANSQVFIPSEEISEDTSVDFPVDI